MMVAVSSCGDVLHERLRAGYKPGPAEMQALEVVALPPTPRWREVLPPQAGAEGRVLALSHYDNSMMWSGSVGEVHHV